MQAGTIILKDITISFMQTEPNNVSVHVADTYTNVNEHLNIQSDKFFRALSIFVNNDGMPDEQDTAYQEAESIMGKIRWIP